MIELCAPAISSTNMPVGEFGGAELLLRRMREQS